MGGGHDPAPHKCGLAELLIFVSAIIAGTACSICSKLLMSTQSVGLDGNENEKFSKPLFQTFGMFLGMLLAFPIHWLVVYLRVPFPGYKFKKQEAAKTSAATNQLGYGATEADFLLGNCTTTTEAVPRQLSRISETSFESKSGSPNTTTVSRASRNSFVQQQQQQQRDDEDDAMMNKCPLWMYFFLAIPSIFDLIATALCMLGLQYLNVSTYQMLRGSGIVFVAIMKQNVLGHRLHKFQWVGVFWNVVSVFLVGGTAMLASRDEATVVSSSSSDATTTASTAVLGVLFVLSGAFVQALQFVFEEKVMSMEDSVPPLFLIGMEGVWGTLLCVTVLYPLAYLTPGTDHGSYENPYNTWAMIQNSSTIQTIFTFYFLTILAYNILACLVTYMLNSVWHAILDNFRPITVWVVDLFIFYALTHGGLGESWSAKWSWVQLVGMFVLLYGTAIYNAPNAGSIRLTGQWLALGLDYSDEYNEIERQREDEEMDARWEELRRKAKTRTLSSPKMSLHTLNLRGTLGSPKI